MPKKLKILSALLVAGFLIALTGWYLHRYPVPVLQPVGPIGHKERNLMLFTVLISIAVVVPVFSLLGYIVWKYREGNTKAKYSPEQDGSRMAETVWWLVPTVIMSIIAVVTWQSTYALDPYNPLSTTKKTLHVQVVALDWKWLFIYPGQQVASVNEAAVPVGVPVDFEITSDTVMSSFWVPSLGGQMYAMTGMSTHLNLQADKTGNYNGSAANISGKGFAGMKFVVRAVPNDQFKSWVGNAHRSSHPLDSAAYTALAKPSYNNKPAYYSDVSPDLYDTIMMKYMMPTADVPASGHGIEPSSGGTGY
jgi:cytochrome o ubiquinol oxidase subunit 2